MAQVKRDGITTIVPTEYMCAESLLLCKPPPLLSHLFVVILYNDDEESDAQPSR